MENFLSLLESVDPSWPTPSSTAWAMDMILAFVCGLGLFRLLLPLLPLDSPSPTPAQNTTSQKVVRKEYRNIRKKIRTVKAYRGSRKKPKEDEVLGSLLHSMQERLVNTISICQHLGQDASCEAFKPDAAKAHLPRREPTGKSVDTKSSLETSSVPRKEHLLLKDFKPLSTVLLNSSPIESQSSVSASSPPETLTSGRRHSPPQQRAPSYPSHPRDPVACPPSMPDPSMATADFEWKMLATSQSHILPGLPSPMPTTTGTNRSRRPTLTTPGLNYSRSTSTRPDLDHFSRPTSNTPGLNHLSRSTSASRGLEHSSRPTSTTSGLDPISRPTSTIPGLEHSSRPISDPFMYQITSRTLCHSTSSPDESLHEDLSLTIHKTYWTGPTDRQREAEEPSFISPVIQEMPEVQISQRVQLKVSKGKIKGRSDLSCSCTGSMLQECSSKETTITAHSVWSKEFKSEQILGHQKVLPDDFNDKYIQFYWGLPWLHSESLVAHVSMAGSPLDPPSILFNGLSTYSPLDINTKGLPQLCSPKPLLPHLVKSQPLSPKFSWSRTPSETRIQAKAHDPSSLSKLPCDSAPIRDNRASRLTPSRAKFIVSPRVQNLEHHLLKKYRESRSDLPVMVKRSLEEFNQQTFKNWGLPGQEPVVHLQGDYISPELQEQMEEPFKKRLKQHQGQWPPKVQLFLGLGQAEVNHRISCPSAQENESSQRLQTVSSKGPETLQPGKTPHKNLPNLLGRALEKDLHRPPEGSRGKVLEAFSETEGETCHMRRQTSDLQSVSPVGPGTKQLGGTMRNNANPKRKQTSDSEVPRGVCNDVCVDHALIPSEIPKPNLKTLNKPSFNEAITNKNGPSFLDPGTQKVLEAHITKHLVRHRWHLPLRGLKTINILKSSNASLSWESTYDSMIKMASDLGEPIQQAPERDTKIKPSSVESQSTQDSPFVLQPAILREVPPSNNSVPSEAPTTAQAFNALNMKKATTSPYPQSSNASLSWESTHDSMIEMASSLREPIQQAPEKDMKAKASSVESQTTKNSPSVLQPALLREVQPNNNSVPSEAPTTAQVFNVTSVSTPKCLVGRAWHRDTVVRSSAEYPELNPCRVQEVWEPPESEGVTLRQNYHHGVSVREISGASQSSYSRDTRELEETEEEESCNWTRPDEAGKRGDFPNNHLLDTSGNPSSPYNTYYQDVDDSSLSSAAGLALRDYSPGKVGQDWAPEVLLAADILASRTSRSTFKKEPTTTKAPFLDRSSLSSRRRSVHKNYKLQGLQHNRSFITNTLEDRYRSPPRQDTQLKGTKPVQAHTLNNENFWDRIKKFILSVLTPKSKLQENPKQKCKALPSITQSQGPLIGSWVPPNPVTRPVYHQEPKKHQKSISTVYYANLKSQPSFDTGMPYGNKQAWATRDPVSRATPHYKRAHMPHAPGIPVCCPRHGH